MIRNVIAIDVLLVPDNNMDQRARDANAQLRQNYPEGCSFDASHVPHITLLHRYVHTGDLKAIAAAVAELLASENLTDLHLKATSYNSHPWGAGDLGVIVMTIEVSPALQRLEDAIVEAVQPFSVSGGTAEAFVPNSDGSPIGREIVKYVEQFVPSSSGERYFPHVTLGLGHRDFLRELEARPFAAFSFKADGVAIYQLGDYGTARKKLWSWLPKS